MVVKVHLRELRYITRSLMWQLLTWSLTNLAVSLLLPVDKLLKIISFGLMDKLFFIDVLKTAMCGN